MEAQLKYTQQQTPAKPRTKKKGPFIGQATIQKKLAIGASNDAYEVEADRMADQVVGMSDTQQVSGNTGSLVQRKCADCEEEGIQMKSLAASISPLVQGKGAGSSGGEASQALTQQINSSKGRGSKMDGGTQNFMENRFGTNFSDVKIHTGRDAIQMNRELSAQAFTVGNDIYFNEGKYNPNSTEGKHLLAHELTHTIQQQGGVQKKVQRFYTEDCDRPKDTVPHIIPADGKATTMAKKAVTALSASTISSSTEALLDKHFNSHSASTVAAVLAVFKKIKAALVADDYTYECEDDCDGENAYVYAIWSDIHLCMNVLRGKDNKGIAAIIVHEFSHYYGGTDDEQYYFSFGVGSAPSSLSVSDAIDNADSYEGFAYDIY